MGTTHTCDRCGTVLHHGEMWMADVYRVGDLSGLKRMLCADCAKMVSAAVRKAMDAAKDELRGDAD